MKSGRSFSRTYLELPGDGYLHCVTLWFVLTVLLVRVDADLIR